MYLKYLTVLLSILVLSCQDDKNSFKEMKDSESQQQTKPLSKPLQSQNISDNFTVKTIFSPDIGWGYQILNNDKLYINQPHIPAVAGIKGFSDENKAQITANFMIYKLNNGIFPPTISVEELDSLGVLNDD